VAWSVRQICLHHHVVSNTELDQCTAALIQEMLQLRIYIFVNLFNDSWRQAGGVEVNALAWGALEHRTPNLPIRPTLYHWANRQNVLVCRNIKKFEKRWSRACGILSKLKHHTALPVLKAVYNSLIHPYLNYSVLNWGRASNATIQPLTKLQNKAIKIINPTNTGSLEEHFQHLNILCLPKL